MYTCTYDFIVMLKYERQDKSANTFDPSPQPLNPPTYFMSYSTNSMDKVRSQRGQEAVTYFRPDPRRGKKRTLTGLRLCDQQKGREKRHLVRE